MSAALLLLWAVLARRQARGSTVVLTIWTSYRAGADGASSRRAPYDFSRGSRLPRFFVVSQRPLGSKPPRCGSDADGVSAGGLPRA